MKRIYSILFLIYLLTNLAACKKFVELDVPDDRLNYSTAFSTNTSAASVVNGIYIRIMETANAMSPYASTYLSYSSDEIKNYFSNSAATITLLYQNNLNSASDLYWASTYRFIYQCNAAIEGLEASTTLNDGLKQQLLGETKFMRALCYYYLVNTYGKVPLLLTSDYRLNGVARRAEIAQVYAQMISDLLDAKSRLSKDYLGGNAMTVQPASSAERVRPTYWAAAALLARVYLYNQRWAEAENEASILISNTALFSLLPPAQVFLRNSRESIFQFQTVTAINYSLQESRHFVLGSSVGTASNPGAISPQLSQAFEVNDLRKLNWVGSALIGGVTYLYPSKYKSNTGALAAIRPENLTILRLAEQYLIRAEARAQQNNISGATSDIDVIRSRAGLVNTVASSQAAVLDAVMKERQIELFAEQGHRWFDLKRTGRIDAVMNVVSPNKGGAWAPFKQLFPLPGSELILNSNLDQNPGYN